MNRSIFVKCVHHYRHRSRVNLDLYVERHQEFLVVPGVGSTVHFRGGGNPFDDLRVDVVEHHVTDMNHRIAIIQRHLKDAMSSIEALKEEIGTKLMEGWVLSPHGTWGNLELNTQMDAFFSKYIKDLDAGCDVCEEPVEEPEMPEPELAGD